MNILLTGGSGFIGRNICQQLTGKYNIYAPTQEKLDVRDPQAVEYFVRGKKIRVIIHAAVEVDQFATENIMRMFDSILRVSNRVDKILHLGSGAEYGKHRDLIKVTETDFGKVVPRDSYGFGKYMCSQIAKENKKIVTWRLFGVYGGHENYLRTFISNSIVKNLLGLPIRIKQEVIFDYLYIKDLIAIVDLFLTRKFAYRQYNITPTESISLTKIAQIINSVAPTPLPVIVENKGLNFQYSASNKRLKKELPQLRFTSYQDGIAALYNYYAKTIRSIDKKAVVEDIYFKQAKIKHP